VAFFIGTIEYLNKECWSREDFGFEIADCRFNEAWSIE
jgi:hypothetical protein